VYGTVAPLVRLTEPTASEPIAGSAWLALDVQVRAAVPPAGMLAIPAPVGVEATAAPPTLIEQPLAAVLEVPLLVSVITHLTVLGAAPDRVHCETCAETCAELVNDPNRPKTNPAMAIAAMRVIAMRMTVASTGDMAFLFFL